MTRRKIQTPWIVLAIFAWAIGGWVLASAAVAAEPDRFSPHQIEFFESKVRPILSGTCLKCHGAATHKGGLRLDSRESVLKGGDSGAAVVPGKPTDSPMIDAINYRGIEMPPTGKLNPREIAALVEWVKMGAPWPKESPSAAAVSRRSDFTITDEDRKYWAFQPVGHPSIPKIRRADWVANPIDAFVLARLEDKGLAPNPPADPRTLVRRLFFDLIGLPPTPEEVDRFVADHSPQAYERLVDELLARKQYGERWGRHWLDVTRYAQTNGYERDAEKPESWRYRDYVIAALNDDKPYNRFVLEQLAGDELPDATNESIIATGFYRLGIWDDEPDNQKAAAWDEIDEIVRTTGASFLGLTLGCARCHNHMFDPIPQEDYYQFAAFFRNVEPYGVPVSVTHMRANDEGILTPLTSPHEYGVWHVHQTELSRQLAKTEGKLKTLRKQALERLQASGVADASRFNSRDIDKRMNSAESAEKARINAEFKRLEEALRTVPFPRALSVRECGSPLKETRVLLRGNVATPGKRVEPRILTVLGGKKIEAVPASYNVSSNRPNSVHRLLAELGVKPTLGLRRQLAEWITGNDNPLTPRVMMNRLWQEHFGRGIVRSADNFGRAGTPPTHPELLAWLARDFMAGSWRLKRMQKQIVLSNAYQMSSAEDNSQAQATDADNDLLWRQNLRRLDAEAIRDEMLAVSGRLNLKMGGPGMFPRLSAEVLETESRPGFGWGQSSLAERSRRSIYIYIKRTLMVPFLETFDYTNTAESLGTRPITTVAPQALLLLNSEFANEQAQALAGRVRREAGAQPSNEINRLFRLALGRTPTRTESEISMRMLEKPTKKGTDALQSLCLVVLNLNEFVYVD
ncbi:MAG TPA: PSD1 and planctomycete cytochrome C domain-containing protein [Planctomycetaceae bacterium]|jgi:hypothetical protein|nr:PSD1 and planctomycete cytochrome C domain-containing protein [Planctomycetaceae bacterium]